MGGIGNSKLVEIRRGSNQKSSMAYKVCIFSGITI